MYNPAMHEHRSNPSLPSWPYLLSIVGLFFLVCFGVYGWSLHNNFIALDDTFLIYNNPVIRHINAHTLKIIFTTYDPELYIPLTFFTYQLDYLIYGLHPFIYHFTNLLLHTFNSILVAWVLYLLLKRGWIAIVLGLLFVIHPQNTETVAWAAARKDTLSALFFLGTIISYFYYRSNGKWFYALSLLLFILGLLSKVMVVTIPVVLLLMDFQERRPWSRNVWIDKIPYLALSILFGFIGLFGKKEIVESSTILQKIIMAMRSTEYYLQSFIFPVNLSVLYPTNHPISLAYSEYWLPAVIVLLLIAFVIWSLRYTRSIAFGFSFFLLTLAPSFINFAKGGEFYFASDRYAYIPSIGLLFLLGLLIAHSYEHEHAPRKRDQLLQGLAVICSVVLITSSILAYKQSMVWADSETLFKHTLLTYPYSTAARVNLSVIYRTAGKPDDELKQLKEALTYRDNSKIHTGLGAIAVRNGNYDEAKAEYAKAMELDPINSEPHFGLGILYANQGDISDAYAEYHKALELDPKYMEAYNNLGSLYLEQGRLQDAEQTLRKAVELNDGFKEAHFNLAMTLWKQNRLQEAIVEMRKVLELDPQNIDALLQIAAFYLQTGENSAALNTLKTVLTIDSKNEAAKAIVQQMIDKGILGNK